MVLVIVLQIAAEVANVAAKGAKDWDTLSRGICSASATCCN